MIKKIILLMVLCLTVFPVSSSFASGFISCPESKNIIEKTYGWNIELVRQSGDKEDTLYCFALRKGKDTVKQKDDTLVFQNKYLTIVETSNEDEDIILKIHNIKIDDNLYSENFTLNKKDNEFILTTKYDDVVVKITKLQKTYYRGGILY